MTTFKNVFFLFLASLSVSISAQQVLDNIFIPPIEITYPDVKEIVLAKESALPDNPVKIEGLDYSINWACGVMPSVNEELSAEQVLSNAAVVYRFNYLGISEKWIPINGKSEQFYVFKLGN